MFRRRTIHVTPKELPPSQRSAVRSASARKVSVREDRPEDETCPLGLVLFVGLSTTGEALSPLTKKWDAAEDQRRLTKYLLSVRFKICLLLCGALFLMSFINVSMGISIICMVKPAENSMKNPRDLITSSNRTNDSQCVKAEKVYWGPTVQGLVLSSMSWGRLFTPGAGLLTDKINVKAIIASSIAVACAMTALIPISALRSVYAIITLRVVTGLCDAFIQPSINRFICLWFPIEERNSALGIATSGRQIAILFAFPLAGLFCCHCEWFGGWPLVFYIPLVLGLIWEPLWLIWSSQNPIKHKRIRPSERKYITDKTRIKSCKERHSVPWRLLLFSPSLWANIGAILCHEIPLAVIFIFFPAYMHDVLGFGYSTNGLLSALPACAFLITKLIAVYVSDKLQQQNFPHLSRTRLAKIFNGIASLGLGLLIMSVALFDHSTRYAALGVAILAVGFAGLHTPGAISTLISIAPKFSGTIAGITFFVIGIAVLLNPLLVRQIVRTGSQKEWTAVMIGTGVIALLPLVFFTIFGSAEEQAWAKESQFREEMGTNFKKKKDLIKYCRSQSVPNNASNDCSNNQKDLAHVN